MNTHYIGALSGVGNNSVARPILVHLYLEMGTLWDLGKFYLRETVQRVEFLYDFHVMTLYFAKKSVL